MELDSESRQPHSRAHALDHVAMLLSDVWQAKMSGCLLFCKNLKNLRKHLIASTLSQKSWSPLGDVGLVDTDSMCPPPGERLAVVEVQCERLRMLYRDCARPPPPPLQADRRQVSPLRRAAPARLQYVASRVPSGTLMIIRMSKATWRCVLCTDMLSSLNRKAH